MKKFLDFKLIYIKTIISKDSTLQALIGTEIIMNDLGKPRSFYFELICISDKTKTNWVFINAQNGEKVMQTIFPELSLHLPIKNEYEKSILHLLPDGLITRAHYFGN